MNYDQKFWESNARRYQDDGAVRIDGVRRVVEVIGESVARAPEHERFLLDLGCGPGIVGEMARPLRCIGVDFSLPMLRLARDRIRELVLADLFHLPFQGACIPHGALLFVLSDYAAKVPALREAGRVLVPGGVLFFADYGRGDELWAFKRENYPRYLGREPRIYLETPGSAARLAEEAGLEVAQAETIRYRVTIDPHRYLRTRTGAPAHLPLARFSLPKELSLTRELFLVKTVKVGSLASRSSPASLGSLLACPVCGAGLKEGPHSFGCGGCGSSYPVEDGIVIMARKRGRRRVDAQAVDFREGMLYTVSVNKPMGGTIMREQVEKTLSRIRTRLQADGGDVELVGVEDGVVKVRLKGACGGCPMAAMTLRNVIEGMLKNEVPGVKTVEAVP